MIHQTSNPNFFKDNNLADLYIYIQVCFFFIFTVVCGFTHIRAILMYVNS